MAAAFLSKLRFAIVQEDWERAEYYVQKSAQQVNKLEQLQSLVGGHDQNIGRALRDVWTAVIKRARMKANSLMKNMNGEVQSSEKVRVFLFYPGVATWSFVFLLA
jgi:hypothetical protein